MQALGDEYEWRRGPATLQSWEQEEKEELRKKT